MAYVDVTSEDIFQKEVLESSLPVLVDFWAEWCGPCKMVEPLIDVLEKKYDGRVIFAKLNVDILPAIASKYGVQSIPTMISFKGNAETERLIGAHPMDDYEKMINGVL